MPLAGLAATKRDNSIFFYGQGSVAGSTMTSRPGVNKRGRKNRMRYLAEISLAPVVSK